jgi:hypothetical protein
MPTVGEVYNPLVEARNDPELFEKLLRETGELLFEHNPGKISDAEHGYQAAKHNLNYYCQYYDGKIASEVKARLGTTSWVGLRGEEIVGAYPRGEQT